MGYLKSITEKIYVVISVYIRSAGCVRITLQLGVLNIYTQLHILKYLLFHGILLLCILMDYIICMTH